MAIQQNSHNSGHPSGSPTSAPRSTSNRPKKSYSQGKNTSNTRPSSGNGQTRNAKRARWAKRSKPVARPVAPRRENAFEYISTCCSLPARKPRAGEKSSVKNPETGKFKDEPKGLGHWRCTGCGKATKVTPRKPQPKINTVTTVGDPHLTNEQKASIGALPTTEVPVV